MPAEFKQPLLAETSTILVVVTGLMNIADALFTVLELRLGVEEANPLMGGVLVLGVPAFLLFKMLFVSTLLFLVWRLGRTRAWCMLSLAGLAGVYCCLFALHAVILWSP